MRLKQSPTNSLGERLVSRLNLANSVPTHSNSFISSKTSTAINAGLKYLSSTMNISCSAPMRIISVSNQSSASIVSSAFTSFSRCLTNNCSSSLEFNLFTFCSPISYCYSIFIHNSFQILYNFLKVTTIILIAPKMFVKK